MVDSEPKIDIGRITAIPERKIDLVVTQPELAQLGKRNLQAIKLLTYGPIDCWGRKQVCVENYRFALETITSLLSRWGEFNLTPKPPTFHYCFSKNDGGEQPILGRCRFWDAKVPSQCKILDLVLPEQLTSPVIQPKAPCRIINMEAKERDGLLDKLNAVDTDTRLRLNAIVNLLTLTNGLTRTSQEDKPLLPQLRDRRYVRDVREGSSVMVYDAPLSAFVEGEVTHITDTDIHYRLPASTTEGIALHNPEILEPYEFLALADDPEYFKLWCRLALQSYPLSTEQYLADKQAELTQAMGKWASS